MEYKELDEKHLEGLSGLEREEVKNRWRVFREFDDGEAIGNIQVRNVTTRSFVELRKISRKYFGNNDGATLAGMIAVFQMLKRIENIEEKKE